MTQRPAREIDSLFRDSRLLLDGATAHQLEGRFLYYPCSGRDIMGPIRIAFPWVQEFLFCDIRYFTNFRRQDRNMVQARPALRSREFELQDCHCEGVDHVGGDRIFQALQSDSTYGMRTEYYTHVSSGIDLVIRRIRHDGIRYLIDKDVNQIGIFLYRMPGESQLIPEGWWSDSVLPRIVDGGLLLCDETTGLPRITSIEETRHRVPRTDVPVRPASMLSGMTDHSMCATRRSYTWESPAVKMATDAPWRVRQNQSRKAALRQDAHREYSF